MKQLIREKIKTVYVEPGDSITLKYEEEDVLTHTIDKSMTLDEAVIFEVEKGDFKNAKSGIGGAFLEIG